jgi:mycothiol synthase
MTHQASVESFLAALGKADGYPPLSDAKVAALTDPETSVVIYERDHIVAVGACATHLQSDGTTRFALETAVEPSMRFSEFESAVLDAALALVVDDKRLSVWSGRTSLDRVLESRGFVTVRTLALMVTDLPIRHIDTPNSFGVRTFTPDDTADLVAANRLAFAGHREAASLTEEDISRMRALPWFDADGIFVVEDAEGLVGFCWTRVHANGDGEIYRIGVVPQRTGSGAGRVALRAGFDYLAAHADVRRGTLWVDTSNDRAMRLYSAAGMEIERTIKEFERS